MQITSASLRFLLGCRKTMCIKSLSVPQLPRCGRLRMHACAWCRSKRDFIQLFRSRLPWSLQHYFHNSRPHHCPPNCGSILCSSGSQAFSFLNYHQLFLATGYMWKDCLVRAFRFESGFHSFHWSPGSCPSLFLACSGNFGCEPETTADTTIQIQEISKCNQNPSTTCSINPEKMALIATNQQPKTDSRQRLPNSSGSIFQNPQTEQGNEHQHDIIIEEIGSPQPRFLPQVFSF